jgi:hypothetical protein
LDNRTEEEEEEVDDGILILLAENPSTTVAAVINRTCTRASETNFMVLDGMMDTVGYGSSRIAGEVK